MIELFLGHSYFISIVGSPTAPADLKIMSAFILSVIASNCRPGQSACLSAGFITLALHQLHDPEPLVRRWMLLGLAKVWESYDDAKRVAVRENAPGMKKVVLKIID